MELNTVIRSFRNGFDWLSDRRVYSWFGLLVVLWVIAYAASALLSGTAFDIVIFVIDYAMKFVGLFIVVPVALKHYGEKTGFGGISFTEIKEWVKYTVVNLVVQFFNWQDKRILAAQVVIAAAGLIVWFSGFDQQMIALNAIDQTNLSTQALEGINLTIVAVGLAVIGLLWLFQTYNLIRYSLLIQVRLAEGKDIMDSVGKAWKLTDGRLLTTLALLIVWSIFSFIMNWVASAFSGMLFFFSGIMFSFLTITWAFVFTSYYLSLKGSAHGVSVPAPAKKRPPIHAVHHKK